jgi:hypothetical protein
MTGTSKDVPGNNGKSGHSRSGTSHEITPGNFSGFISSFHHKIP